MKKEKEIFIEKFVDYVGHFMYEHVDPWDYSLGMQGLSTETIKDIAEGFFETLFIDNKELRQLKLRKLEK